MAQKNAALLRRNIKKHGSGFCTCHIQATAELLGMLPWPPSAVLQKCCASKYVSCSLQASPLVGRLELCGGMVHCAYIPRFCNTMQERSLENKVEGGVLVRTVAGTGRTHVGTCTAGKSTLYKRSRLGPHTFAHTGNRPLNQAIVAFGKNHTKLVVRLVDLCPPRCIELRRADEDHVTVGALEAVTGHLECLAASLQRGARAQCSQQLLRVAVELDQDQSFLLPRTRL
mmetsp:Transcript_113097/g.365516  ORF Transcript_113097/g.365516 Transcript_113097/m.365516 type:complete len:228 (+) Transcript_113097:334-1017(+)